MSAVATERGSAAPVWGWWILVVLYPLLAANGVFLYLSQLTPAVFEQDTGLSLREVEAVFPVVIDYLAFEVRLAALLTIGVALMGFAAALAGLRSRERSLWWPLWVPPLMLAAVTAHLFAWGQTGVAIYYLALAAAALVGQVLTSGGRAAPRP